MFIIQILSQLITLIFLLHLTIHTIITLIYFYTLTYQHFITNLEIIYIIITTHFATIYTFIIKIVYIIEIIISIFKSTFITHYILSINL